MKKVLKIIAIVIACFLGATLIAAVIGRGVTGKWNPVEWGNSTGITQPKDGVDGKDGIDGKDGETPYIGENGNWFIGEVDTGVKAEGKDGVDGIDGKDGVDGKAELYRHHITCEQVGVAMSTVYFDIISTTATPFTTDTLPKFTAAVRDWSTESIAAPLAVFNDGTGLKVKIYNDVGDNKVKIYVITSFTDVVEAV